MAKSLDTGSNLVYTMCIQMKSRWFNFRLSDSEHKELKALANKEDRSVANFIKWLIKQYKDGKSVRK